MVLSTTFCIRILDLYFDEAAPPDADPDIIRWHQFSKPMPASRCAPFPTLVLDLSLPADALLANIKKQTRYEIRRASEKDDLSYEAPPDPGIDVIKTFADHFDSCAALKGMSKASRRRLSLLVRHNSAAFSFIRESDGSILAANAYILTPRRARLFYTASTFRGEAATDRRALVGRATRLLVWRDILRFQENGVGVFDFGGWYSGREDEERLRINGFKEKFGGRLLEEWNCQRAATLTGSAALLAMEWRRRIQERRSRAAGPIVLGATAVETE